jgi:hypothetical protein
VIWKVWVTAFTLVGKWKAWKVRKGNRDRIGEDPWLGCLGNYVMLSEPLKNALNNLGIYHLSDIADPESSNISYEGWKPAL